MLTGKHTRYLRGLAHDLNPIMQVGKGGITENLLDQIGLALEARELIKLSILPTCEFTAKIAGETLAMNVKADLVQVIGRTVVLYRRSQDHKTIVLPR